MEEETWETRFDQSFIASEEPQTHNAYPFNIRPLIHEALKEWIKEEFNQT